MTVSKIVLANNLEELEKLNNEIEVFVENNELPMKLSFTLSLVLEELITNTISYGYSDKDTHEIFITMVYENDEIKIVIIDDARPFNPVMKEDPDVNASLENRPIGGLGIHLVKQMMDDVEYEYKDNKNVITLIKRNLEWK